MQRTLPLGLLALAAFALPATAMYVDPQGRGEVLLFPYYTVNAGQATVLTLHNSTARSKALRVQLRESYNGRDVGDFSVYLGPHDSWTGTVFGVGNTQPARLHTRDLSCTAPDKPEWTAHPGGGWSFDFTPYGFMFDSEDTGPTTPSRTHEGYVQVFELAELDGPLADAVDSNGPRNCPRVRDIDPASTNLLPPDGGLSGRFAVVDVAAGTMFAGTATAIAGFSEYVLFSELAVVPEYLRKGNNGQNPVTATVLVDGRWRDLRFSPYMPHRSIDAVSAVLTTDSLLGDVVREPGAASFTEWVLTAPTKPYYTDSYHLGWIDLSTPAPAEPPYDHRFGERYPGASCSRFEASGWDREGNAVALTAPSLPKPPEYLPAHSLCGVADVVYFGDAPASGVTPVLGSARGVRVWNPQPAFEAGSVRLSFATNNAGAPRLGQPDLDGTRMVGLPLISFAAIKYTNGNVTPGVLANYTYGVSLTGNASCVRADAECGN